MPACAPAQSSKSETPTTCQMGSDQSKTYSGQWPVLPVPIAFHSGKFTLTEAQNSLAAFVTWNAFSNVSRSKDVLTFGSRENPDVATPPSLSRLCSQSLLQNGAFQSKVVVTKTNPWPYDKDIVALTTFCTADQVRTKSDVAVGKMYIAILEINTQYFFTAGKRIPDLETIILHESGHVLGLNHSCESTSTDGVPGCDDSATDPNYLSAVMNPLVDFDSNGQGIAKRALQENDMGRLNCLYDP